MEPISEKAQNIINEAIALVYNPTELMVEQVSNNSIRLKTTGQIIHQPKPFNKRTLHRANVKAKKLYGTK